MPGPITPADAKAKKEKTIPEEVYDAFNELIIKNLSSDGTATVTQAEAMDLICKKMPAVTRQQVYDHNWMDIESAYRKAGWTVAYDKPGYNETYPACFMFRQKR